MTPRRQTRRPVRRAAEGPEGAVPAGGLVIPCFRCGLCCRRYQPPVTLAEAEAIAAALGLEFNTFLERYVDDSWREPGRLLLDCNHEGACVFLEEAGPGGLASCLIYPVRPQVCRDWPAGLHQRECLEALERDWGLTASPSGKLLGPEENRRRFLAFLRSLGTRPGTGRRR